MNQTPPPAVKSGLGRIASAALVLIFAALLFAPVVSGWAGWKPGRQFAENRQLAGVPPAPRSPGDVGRYLAGLSAYLNDNYGLRTALVALDGRLRYRLFSEFASDQVLLGRHGRLFFISHSAGNPFSLTDLICGTPFSPAQDEAAAAGMAKLLEEGASVTQAAFYVSVPTAPVIYHADLPRWLARRCDRTAPFVQRLAKDLQARSPDLGRHLIYPLDVLNAAKLTGLPYPIWNFHWSGIGARAVEEYVGGTVLGLPRRVTLADAAVSEPTDLTQFIPGIVHRDEVPMAEHERAGVDFCYGGGGACGADFAPFANAINEISRSTWRQGQGPSLLIISDSFGRMPARYFSQHFARMLHLNIAFERLKPGELPQLANQIAAGGRPDVLLFILHDAAAVDAGGLAGPFATIAAAFGPR